MNICIKCKHCKIESYGDLPCADLKCKKQSAVDHISGYMYYKYCKDVNTDGKCPDFEMTRYWKFIKWLKGE